MVAPFSWTGFYVGINGGYGWGTSDWTGAGFDHRQLQRQRRPGRRHLGYNLQTGVWVWGLEGDFDASWMKGTDTAVCGGSAARPRTAGSAPRAARIGYAWDRFLPYLTGGAAFGNIKMTPRAATATKTKVGWTAGAGVEWAFLGDWSAKTRISLCRPRQGDLRRGHLRHRDRRQLQGQRGPRRRELPLLLNRRAPTRLRAGLCAGPLFLRKAYPAPSATATL